MPFSFSFPKYQKVQRNEVGVSKSPSGAQLNQLMKAASRDELVILPNNKNTRSAILFERAQVNVSNLKAYITWDNAGHAELTSEGHRLVAKDSKKKKIFGAIRAVTAPTIVGVPIALAVYKGYMERRDDDKYSATDVTRAVKEKICSEVAKNKTVEGVKAVADKYGVSQYDVATWARVQHFYPLSKVVLPQPPAGS
jgi:hypothetical protein